MNNIKISWNITEKKGGKAWYVILSWYDSEGKRKQKSKTTGIPLKGNNKKRAKDAAKLIAEHFEAELNEHERAKSRLLFSDYMYQWLNSRKHNIRQNTYDGYKLIIDSSIKPYFDSIGAELETLTSQQIQAYYQLLFDKGLSTSTVKHHHANISSALKMAIKQRLLVCRYADGRKLGCDYLSKRFKEILGKLGINGHLHSLRHTVGTLMCNGGNVNIKTVSAYLGHSNLASTNIYLHSDLQAKAEAANILSKMINHRS